MSSVATSGDYWGDPAGPGADPADAVCANVPAVIVEAPGAKPAKIRMPGIK